MYTCTLHYMHMSMYMGHVHEHDMYMSMYMHMDMYTYMCMYMSMHILPHASNMHIPCTCCTHMCMTVRLTQVAPAGARDKEKLEYLEKQWALADTDGDGTVDFQEFVEFYVQTLEALAAEEAARHAFSRYDVDDSNTLEKHELVQALFELDMVPGHDAHEKRVYLEDQFAVADTNGDGVVDFAEFIAFYTTAMHDSRKSDLVHERRRKTKRAREQREARALKYVQPDCFYRCATCSASRVQR